MWDILPSYYRFDYIFNTGTNRKHANTFIFQEVEEIEGGTVSA